MPTTRVLDAKPAHIRDVQQRGRRVAYVGDGTNDAPPISGVMASIAVAGSTDEALAASRLVMFHGRRVPSDSMWTAHRTPKKSSGSDGAACPGFAASLPDTFGGLRHPMASTTGTEARVRECPSASRNDWQTVLDNSLLPEEKE